MSRKKQSGIRPENVGQLFLKVDDVIPYRLVSCGDAVFHRVDRVSMEKPERITDILEKYVLLKPVYALEKPKPVRADKGQKHQRKAQSIVTGRICPTHKFTLVKYGDKYKCPEPSCDFEEPDER